MDEKKEEPVKRTGVHARGRKPGSGTKPLDQHVIYVTMSFSCLPEERDEILRIVAGSGKTRSRFIVDSLLKNKDK